MKRLKHLFSRANRAWLALRLLALWKLFRHPATPRAAKWLAAAVVAYAVSPIDLIPDFIPVLGLLDDLLLLPLGIALVIRLTPKALWQARLAEVESQKDKLPRLLWGAFAVLAIWLLCAGLFAWWLWGLAMAG